MLYDAEQLCTPWKTFTPYLLQKTDQRLVKSCAVGIVPNA